MHYRNPCVGCGRDVTEILDVHVVDKNRVLVALTCWCGDTLLYETLDLNELGEK
jgi:hypothetical protein